MASKLERIPKGTDPKVAKFLLEATQGGCDLVDILTAIVKFVYPDWGPAQDPPKKSVPAPKT